MEISINYLAIAVAVFINFILGWLWYGPLFGKTWANEMKMDKASEEANKSKLLLGMVFMVFGNFLTAFVISHDIYAWSNVPGMSNMKDAGFSPIFMTAFFTWLGFYVPTHIGATVWENKSWKLTAINLSYHFVSLLVAAAILIKMGC